MWRWFLLIQYHENFSDRIKMCTRTRKLNRQRWHWFSIKRKKNEKKNTFLHFVSIHCYLFNSIFGIDCRISSFYFSIRSFVHSKHLHHSLLFVSCFWFCLLAHTRLTRWNSWEWEIIAFLLQKTIIIQFLIFSTFPFKKYQKWGTSSEGKRRGKIRSKNTTIRLSRIGKLRHKQLWC